MNRTKENLIYELKKEINSSKLYDRETISYIGRNVKEAEELLEKIESGEFDQILLSTNVRLATLSKWDLSRESVDSNPTLKDFRIYCFIEKLNEKIEDLNQSDLSLDNIKSKKDKYVGFLSRLKSGIYDDILNTKDFWFWDPIDFNTFLSWDETRKTNNNPNDINLPNYIVFAVYSEMMSHINDINSWKDQFGSYYRTRYTNHQQTPTTDEELQEFKLLENEIVQINYDWRETREVVRYFNGLEIYENYKFPHNIEDIKKIFRPTKTILFSQYEGMKECSHNIDEIMIRAKQTAEELSPDNLANIFLNQNENAVDIYLRKMISSQFDCKLLSEDSCTTLSEETIQDMLENPNNYSEYEIKTLLSNENFKTGNTMNSLYNIAYGTLFSLYAYHRGSNIQLLTEAINLQKRLNCWEGTVYYNDVNSVCLPNGEVLYSTPYEYIEEQYARFQEEYEYYHTNSSSDLEYIEGCTEIIGNVVTSQIFRVGNKRTAKCLFNALLMSKGIVPPIIDFNKHNAKLWNDFAYNINNKYMSVKKEILEASLRTYEYGISPEIQKEIPNNNSETKTM